MNQASRRTKAYEDEDEGELTELQPVEGKTFDADAFLHDDEQSDDEADEQEQEDELEREEI